MCLVLTESEISNTSVEGYISSTVREGGREGGGGREGEGRELTHLGFRPKYFKLLHTKWRA